MPNARSSNEAMPAAANTQPDGLRASTPLKRALDATMKESQPQKRSRVSRACDQCRASREKCDGAQPNCQTCALQRRPCSYNEMPKKRGIQVWSDVACAILQKDADMCLAQLHPDPGAHLGLAFSDLPGDRIPSSKYDARPGYAGSPAHHREGLRPYRSHAPSVEEWHYLPADRPNTFRHSCRGL